MLQIFLIYFLIPLKWKKDKIRAYSQSGMCHNHSGLLLICNHSEPKFKFTFIFRLTAQWVYYLSMFNSSFFDSCMSSTSVLKKP